MFKKKPFFIVFEGIEGSGKSYLSKKIYIHLKKKNLKVILTRGPGGTIRAEKIRNIILEDYFKKNKNEKFHKYTDTLLYLAARNEHIINKIKPALQKKQIVICDRFTDSTLAYQVYGKKIKKKFIDNIHNEILNGIKPHITFLLKVDTKSAMKRINKRKSKNRYDKFAKSFYTKAQKAFINIAKKNKKKYYVLDNSKNDPSIQTKILNIIEKKINA